MSAGNLLTTYKAIASVEGVLLIVLVAIGLPLRFLSTPGTSARDLGDFICADLGVAHGWLYLIFLLVTLALSRRTSWNMKFTATTLLCGTVPFLSFWAELRAIRSVGVATALR
ncbi:MAG TPA: DUF3817 domain-containing protein [Rhodopila sp.]